MGYGDTTVHESDRPNATEDGAARAAVMWVFYTVALFVMVVMMIVAAICSPFVVVWCLLFDPD